MQAAEYRAISRYLLHGELPGTFESTRSNFIRKAKLFTVHGGKLHRHGLPVVQFAQRRMIFEQFHDHRGRDHGFATEINTFGDRLFKSPCELNNHDKCAQLVRERYFWPGGYKYISEKTKSCVACAYKKSKQ